MIDDYGPPSATVQVDGDEKQYPCDWQIEGTARGFADWRIVAYGRLEVGAELRITLRCQLGVLTGTALADRVEIDAWGSAETTLRGHGGLTLASEGNHPV